MDENSLNQRPAVPLTVAPMDPHHLLLVKLDQTPKSIQHLMMSVAKDSHPQVDSENNLLINVHFDVVQEALYQAHKARNKDLAFAVGILIAAMAITSAVIMCFR